MILPRDIFHSTCSQSRKVPDTASWEAPQRRHQLLGAIKVTINFGSPPSPPFSSLKKQTSVFTWYQNHTPHPKKTKRWHKSNNPPYESFCLEKNTSIPKNHHRVPNKKSLPTGNHREPPPACNSTRSNAKSPRLHRATRRLPRCPLRLPKSGGGGCRRKAYHHRFTPLVIWWKWIPFNKNGWAKVGKNSCKDLPASKSDLNLMWFWGYLAVSFRRGLSVYSVYSIPDHSTDHTEISPISPWIPPFFWRKIIRGDTLVFLYSLAIFVVSLSVMGRKKNTDLKHQTADKQKIWKETTAPRMSW